MIRGRSLLTVLAVRGRRQIPVDADVTPGPDVREVLAGRQSMIHPRPTGPGRDLDRCQRLEVGADGPGRRWVFGTTRCPPDRRRRHRPTGARSEAVEFPRVTRSLLPVLRTLMGADVGDRSNTASSGDLMDRNGTRSPMGLPQAVLGESSAPDTAASRRCLIFVGPAPRRGRRCVGDRIFEPDVLWPPATVLGPDTGPEDGCHRGRMLVR